MEESLIGIVILLLIVLWNQGKLKGKINTLQLDVDKLLDEQTRQEHVQRQQYEHLQSLIS